MGEEGNTVDFNFLPDINDRTNALLTNGSVIVELQAAVVDVILKIEPSSLSFIARFSALYLPVC